MAGDSQKKGSHKRRQTLESRCGGRRNYARIRVNRGNLPAIKRVLPGQAVPARQESSAPWRYALIGAYLFRDAFVIQQLANGRWHVMRRERQKPLPIVVKIAGHLLTRKAFETEKRACGQEMPKQLGICAETATEVVSHPMNKHTRRRHSANTGDPAVRPSRCSMVCRHLLNLKTCQRWHVG